MASPQYWYTPAPVGNGSMVANGQIVGVPMGLQFFPNLAAAPFYKGSGQPAPTVPINYITGTPGSTGGMSAAAAANPFSFTQSPLIIAILFLIVGILGLRYIHWR